MQVLKLSYLIGVYDPNFDESWPWHCHYEDGRYLSRKHRICGRERAAEFSTEEEARAFYFQWKHYQKLKFELIPFQFWAEEPDPVYPPEHPRSILKSITKNEPSTIRLTASFWFYGEEILSLYSAKTLNKHREILLRYGIDIREPLPDHLKISPQTQINELPKKPKLTIVK